MPPVLAQFPVYQHRDPAVALELSSIDRRISENSVSAAAVV